MFKILMQPFSYPLVQEVTKFGCVGLLGTAVNFLVVAYLVEQFGFAPLIANIAAFLVAFQVSFVGHKFWTFNACEQAIFATMLKFFAVGVLGFVLNEALYAVFLQKLHIHYLMSLLLVLLIVPPITFVCGKFWAFR